MASRFRDQSSDSGVTARKGKRRRDRPSGRNMFVYIGDECVTYEECGICVDCSN